jgi:hypothetical protein
MALVVAALAAAWSANRDNQLPRLILLVGVGMVTYGGLSLFTQRIQLKDIIRAVFNR